ncbi:MAG: hypothetical protein LUD79_00860 [Oscillospiraceae bacterium]|nr:hypothetical protein [Oscillospiraceae bacterium]
MKAWNILLLSGVLAAMLTGCGSKLPDVADESAIREDLPQELTTVTLSGEAQDTEIAALEILERDTDLTKQTDDVTCSVTLTGEDFSLEYTCLLHYAYVRDTGWTVRSFELTDDPELTLDGTQWLARFREENLTLLTEEGYSNPELTDETWDEADNGYCQTFSVCTEGEFLISESTVTVTGTPEGLGGGFAYQWTTETTEGETAATALLEGTIWHLLSESESLEILFQVEQVEGEILTLSGLIRSENRLGAIRQTTLKTTEVTWIATEHGCITFPLTTVDGEELSCYIQDGEQWVTAGELYLDKLTQETLPASGELSDLMELELTPSLWTPTTPEVQEPGSSGEDEPDSAEAPDSEESGGTLSDLWDSILEFWNGLW